MSRKKELKKLIEEAEIEIESLEKKRNRSQSAILQAFLEHKSPDNADAEYFRVYSQLIDLARANLRKLRAELSEYEK